MNIFKQAVKQGLRFSSSKGQLSVEDLYSLPLTTTRSNQVSLDDVARTIARSIKEQETESFVQDVTPLSTELNLKLDIVKEVIEDKKQERKSKADAVANQKKREKIKEILANKQDDALLNKTPEELEEMLKSL